MSRPTEAGAAAVAAFSVAPPFAPRRNSSSLILQQQQHHSEWDAATTTATTHRASTKTSSEGGMSTTAGDDSAGSPLGVRAGGLQPGNSWDSFTVPMGQRRATTTMIPSIAPTSPSPSPDKSSSSAAAAGGRCSSKKGGGHISADRLRNPCKVFVGGVGQGTVESTIRAHFSQYGTIVDCIIVTHRKSGKSRGFGFITYDSEDAAARAVGAKHKIDDVLVECRQALPKDEARVAAPHDSLYMPTKIFVGGIPDTVEEEDFKAFFSQFGEVIDVSLAYDKSNHRPRGFGFIVFSRLEAAHAAVGRHSFFGKLVEAKRAVPRKPVPRGTRTPQRRSPPPPGASHRRQQQQQQHQAAATELGGPAAPPPPPTLDAATSKQQTNSTGLGSSSAWSLIPSVSPSTSGTGEQRSYLQHQGPMLHGPPPPPPQAELPLPRTYPSSSQFGAYLYPRHTIDDPTGGTTGLGTTTASSPAAWQVFYPQSPPPPSDYLSTATTDYGAKCPDAAPPQLLYARTFTSQRPLTTAHHAEGAEAARGAGDWTQQQHDFRFAQQGFAYAQPASPLVIGRSVPLVQISPQMTASSCSPSFRTLVSNLLSPPQATAEAAGSPSLMAGATLEPLLPAAATGKLDFGTSRACGSSERTTTASTAAARVWATSSRPECAGGANSPRQQAASVPSASSSLDSQPGTALGGSPILTLFHFSQLQQGQHQAQLSLSPKASTQTATVTTPRLFLPCYPGSPGNDDAGGMPLGTGTGTMQTTPGADSPPMHVAPAQGIPGRLVAAVSQYGTTSSIGEAENVWDIYHLQGQHGGFPVASAHGATIQGLGSPIVQASSAAASAAPADAASASRTMTLSLGAPATTLGHGRPVFLQGSPPPPPPSLPPPSTFSIQQGTPGGNSRSTTLFSPCDMQPAGFGFPSVPLGHQSPRTVQQSAPPPPEDYESGPEGRRQTSTNSCGGDSDA